MVKKYKKGDEVIVKVGKDKGKVGKISKVINATDKVVISGVNISKKHQKPSQDSKGGIIDKEMPIHISNVMLWDKENNSASRITSSRPCQGTPGEPTNANRGARESASGGGREEMRCSEAPLPITMRFAVKRSYVARVDSS